MRGKLVPLTVFLIAVLQVSAIGEESPPNTTEITLFRFFGGCSDEYSDVTDLSKAVGECGVIQVLTNKFNAENGLGIRVNTQPVHSGSYYDRLSATLAARRPPDIAVMHRSLLPDFVKRDLLIPLQVELARLGVSWQDFVPAALNGVTFGDRIVALPFDFHALLWHINVGLLSEAGLTEPGGAPRLPSSPNELLEHAKQVKDRTGKRYFAIPSTADPMPIWMYEIWTWQQGADLISPDEKSTYFESDESKRALELLLSLYDLGYANRYQDYVGAEQAFLTGAAAVLVNGTWVVDDTIAQSKREDSRLKEYAARTVPTLFEAGAAWADSHVWILPRSEKRDAKALQASFVFLKFLHDHNGAWARTGHLPVRSSVLDSAEFLALPERRGYASTAKVARSFQPVANQRAIQYALGQAINATWMIPRSPAESLAEADRQVKEILERKHKMAR